MRKTDMEMRRQLLRKIRRIPSDKLKELNDFVLKLEGTPVKKEKILSFAGSWENIDDDLFNEFTHQLISKRESNKRRVNESGTD